MNVVYQIDYLDDGDGLGMFAVQLAARRGARVVAVDSDPAKLKIAMQMGATASELAAPGLAEAWSAALRAHATINLPPQHALGSPCLRGNAPLGSDRCRSDGGGARAA